MVGLRGFSFPRLIMAGMFVLTASSADAAPEVDLALVLAVDISQSMETDEQELQREGYVDAFRSPEVQRAIRQGMLGRIAVVYAEWSGATEQEVVVPWTVIEYPEDALGFAERLAQSPIQRAGYTSVSGAIDFSVGLLRASGIDSTRRVIDISGDGPNNQGRAITAARNEAVAQGITINGLPIMLKQPSGAHDIENLDLYFRDCVIGGPGAFMIPVRGKHQLAEAIKAKIVREISDVRAPEGLVRPTQTTPPTNCLAEVPRPSTPTDQ